MPFCSKRNLVALVVWLALAQGVSAQTVRSNATEFVSVAVETAGSAVAPSITFTTAVTKGLFLADSGSWGLSGHWVPGATATYNLGSSSLAWQDLYAVGTSHLATIQTANGSSGSPAYTFTNDTASGLYLVSSGILGLVGNLRAGTDATYSIGQVTDTRFNNLYLAGLVASDTAQIGAGAPSTSNVLLRSSDASGLLSVKLGDGSDDADLAVRNGTAVSVQLVPGATAQPTCDSSHRGLLWYSTAASGTADSLQLCGRSSNGTYYWVTIL